MTVNQLINNGFKLTNSTYSSWREGMRENIPSVISGRDPLTMLLFIRRGRKKTCKSKSNSDWDVLTADTVPTLQGSKRPVSWLGVLERSTGIVICLIKEAIIIWLKETRFAMLTMSWCRSVWSSGCGRLPRRRSSPWSRRILKDI